MNIWLVEISGTAVRAFTSKMQADLYMMGLLGEYDEELGEERYQDYEIEVVECYLQDYEIDVVESCLEK